MTDENTRSGRGESVRPGQAAAGRTQDGRAPAAPVEAGAVSATDRDDPAYWRAKAAAARENARNLPWTSDPELRAQVDAILAAPPIDRLRQIEAESHFFASIVPADRLRR